MVRIRVAEQVASQYREVDRKCAGSMCSEMKSVMPNSTNSRPKQIRIHF